MGRCAGHECTGNPEMPTDWVGHDLLERNTIHCHSLQLGDINRDGHLDIFAAELAKWHEQQTEPDNPGATGWMFYGDGQGTFARPNWSKARVWHEARLRDFDGDGDLDVLNKPTLGRRRALMFGCKTARDRPKAPAPARAIVARRPAALTVCVTSSARTCRWECNLRGTSALSKPSWPAPMVSYGQIPRDAGRLRVEADCQSLSV